MQTCKIHGFDVIASQNLKSIEQLGCSAENLKETSSSTTHVCVARLLEKDFVCLGVASLFATKVHSHPRAVYLFVIHNLLSLYDSFLGIHWFLNRLLYLP